MKKIALLILAMSVIAGCGKQAGEGQSVIGIVFIYVLISYAVREFG